MQHLHSDPPIVVEASERIPIGIAREELRAAVAAQEKLAVVVHVSQRSGRSLTGTVDLGAIPPGCVDILVPRAVEIGLVQDLILLCAWQLHFAMWPTVALGKGYIVITVTL